jgi:hypothetical protein
MSDWYNTSTNERLKQISDQFDKPENRGWLRKLYRRYARFIFDKVDDVQDWISNNKPKSDNRSTDEVLKDATTELIKKKGDLDQSEDPGKGERKTIPNPTDDEVQQALKAAVKGQRRNQEKQIEITDLSPEELEEFDNRMQDLRDQGTEITNEKKQEILEEVAAEDSKLRDDGEVSKKPSSADKRQQQQRKKKQDVSEEELFDRVLAEVNFDDLNEKLGISEPDSIKYRKTFQAAAEQLAKKGRKANELTANEVYSAVDKAAKQTKEVV